MGFFRREVEVTLKMLGVLALIALIVLPIAWGYEQRRQARAWQNVACAYRIKEITRNAPFIANGGERALDACSMLSKLGLPLPEEDLLVRPVATTVFSPRTRSASQ
jgi:hypothetical protein